MSETKSAINTAREQAHKALRANLAVLDKLTERPGFDYATADDASRSVSAQINSLWCLGSAEDKLKGIDASRLP